MCDTLDKPELKHKSMESIFKEFSTRFTKSVQDLSKFVDEVSDKSYKTKFDDGIDFIEKINQIRL